MEILKGGEGGLVELLGAVVLEPHEEFRGGKRAAEEVALHAIASTFAEHAELLFGFDAFGRDFHFELVAHLDIFSTMTRSA